MGNRALIDKLKQDKPFLGSGKKEGQGIYWMKLDYFYTNELQGDDSQKFAQFEELRKANPKLDDIIEESGINPEEGTMQL